MKRPSAHNHWATDTLEMGRTDGRDLLGPENGVETAAGDSSEALLLRSQGASPYIELIMTLGTWTT